jgi:uncharacterized SAM-binding protein YcdF (DUF218 family)
MIDFVKVWATPGTLPFLAVLLAVGAILAGRASTRRLGWTWLCAALAIYFVLSLPWTAGKLAWSLEGAYDRVAPGDRPEAPAAIVVFDGDHSWSRLREVLRLHREFPGASIVCSGGADLKWALVEAGVPEDLIRLESASRTTREQAVNLALLLRAHGTEPIVLVASGIHMRRALGAVRAVGLRPTPSASPVPPHWRKTDTGRFTPSHGALVLSAEVVYEYLAQAYYRARGWLG